MKYKKFYLIVSLFLIMSGCYQEEELNVPVYEGPDAIRNELDQYIIENFVQEFGGGFFFNEW